MASGLFFPNTGSTQCSSLQVEMFQLSGLELHHPVLRSPRYSTVSTVADEVRLTD